MSKTYLACLSKGTSICQWKTLEIPSREVNVSGIIPTGTYAYFMFDTDVSDVSKLPLGKIYNMSHVTYLGGTIYSSDEVNSMVKEGVSIKTIPGLPVKKLTQMKYFIKTSAGSLIPFFENDVLVSRT